ncbi:uncharacterized protein DUF3396 [Flavobacterium sp. 9]|nr:uncharacterized protein DUF3396 [Flavobacterium sp. 9]
MTSFDQNLILTPHDALERYRDELYLYKADGRLAILPGVIGTVFFERGSKPDVRQGILACFDRFEQMFGEHLKGGKDKDLGGFTKRTPKGLEAIRSAILETPPYYKVSVVRSSATDENTAAEYQITTLTNNELSQDYCQPGEKNVWPKGCDGGQLSFLKFHMPMDFVVNLQGIEQYESFLRFVCEHLPVRGGYGGLSPIRPYRSDNYCVEQERVLAKRFSGLEIDSDAFIKKDNYVVRSYKGKPSERAYTFYPYPHPGAKVKDYGFIKGVNWYTLIGDVFVNRLGGEMAVRKSLARPDIGVERIDACLLIRAGNFPRLGAPEEGLPEPYVFVNSLLRVLRRPSVLEIVRGPDMWIARFDLPNAPPIPSPPKVLPGDLGTVDTGTNDELP